jgi:type II secretory pathway component PulL
MDEAPQQPHGDAHDILMLAYDERTRQLHDARAALSGAVSALTVELSSLREQHDLAHVEIRNLREHKEVLLERIRMLEGELAAIRNRRVVRWTRRPRAALRRLGERRR